MALACGSFGGASVTPSADAMTSPTRSAQSRPPSSSQRGDDLHARAAGRKFAHVQADGALRWI